MIGQVVYSKCGRDKGLPFVIVSVCNDFVYLSDGDYRKFNCPKKKKIKHIQVTNDILFEIKECINENKNCSASVAVHVNSKIKKALSQYKSRNSS